MATHFFPIDSHVPPNFIVNVKNVFTGEQFEQLCRDNPDLRMELTSEGELILMSPTGSKTGARNALILSQFVIWAQQNGAGIVFDSSTGFILPNAARRSPDVAWINLERWNALTEDEQEGFAPLCPDFVLELRSRSDSEAPLSEKMQEWIANGASMSWMIDPIRERVFIYRPGEEPEIIDKPEMVKGDPILPGFALDLREIWEARSSS